MPCLVACPVPKGVKHFRNVAMCSHAKKGKKTPAGKLNALFRRSGGKPAPPAEMPRRSHHSHSLSGTSHPAPSGRGMLLSALMAETCRHPCCSVRSAVPSCWR